MREKRQSKLYNTDIGCISGCSLSRSLKEIEFTGDTFDRCRIRVADNDDLFLEVVNSCSYCGCDQYVNLEVLVSYLLDLGSNKEDILDALREKSI